MLDCLVSVREGVCLGSDCGLRDEGGAGGGGGGGGGGGEGGPVVMGLRLVASIVEESVWHIRWFSSRCCCAVTMAG